MHNVDPPSWPSLQLPTACPAHFVYASSRLPFMATLFKYFQDDYQIILWREEDPMAREVDARGRKMAPCQGEKWEKCRTEKSGGRQKRNTGREKDGGDTNGFCLCMKERNFKYLFPYSQ